MGSPSVNPTINLPSLRTPLDAQDDPIHIFRVLVEEPAEEFQVGRLVGRVAIKRSRVDERRSGIYCGSIKVGRQFQDRQYEKGTAEEAVQTYLMASKASSSFLTSLGSHQVIIMAPKLTIHAKEVDQPRRRGQG